MNPNFWTGKKVFLTGHTGFKGSWLTMWLEALGANIAGYSLKPPTQPNLFTLGKVREGIVDLFGDVRDLELVCDAMKAFAPEIVFHLAAQPIVRTSYLVPAETYAVNAMGTVNVLEAVRATSSVKATIIVTSDKCYENQETIWPYREIDAMGGHDPYSSSKGCAELITSAYGRSYFAPGMGLGALASVRAGNVIGGGDWAADRLVADLMRGLLAGEKIVIRRPQAVRPWQHVLEPLSGYILAAERLYSAGSQPYTAWNFGPDVGSNQTVEILAREICKLWGNQDALRIGEGPHALHEAGLLTLDSTKARTELRWLPRWGFGECLTKTVEWFIAYKNGCDMRRYTLEQIDDFMRSLPSN